MTLAIEVPAGLVHYEDNRYMVSVRNPNEWHDLREFLKPFDPSVQQLLRDIGPDQQALLDWVCRNITYTSDEGEYWRFPGETIREKIGDCDDSAILVESLLLNVCNPYIVVGTYQGFGHAWVELDGQILETTYTYAHAVPDPGHYKPYIKWNESEVIEMWPGSLGQIFKVTRGECRKLALMAEAVAGSSDIGLTLLLGITSSILGGIIVATFMRR